VIVFHLPGGTPVYAFSLLIGIGAGLGLVWISWQNVEDQTHAQLDAGLWALLASLLGARLVWVGLNWQYYRLHLPEIPQVHLGGLAWPGALAGGLLGVAVFARVMHQPAGALADGLLPLGTSMALFAWLGCWVDGCAYGQVSQAWWSLPSRDEWGTLAPRVPLQLAGALLSLLTLWLVEQNRVHLSIPGQAAAVWLGAMAAQMLLAAFLRADPAPTWQGIRLDAWSAAIFMVLALLSFGLSLIHKPALVKES